jgi:hypothetical protein
MSKIRLYGETSGFVELQAPDVADDGVLVLPTSAQGFGKVKQIIQATDATERTSTSTSFASAGLSANITPQKTGNLIIATWSKETNIRVNNDIEAVGATRIVVDSTAILGAEGAQIESRAGQAATANTFSLTTVDTGFYTTVGTSEITFICEFRLVAGTNIILRNARKTGVLTLMEVEL